MRKTKLINHDVSLTVAISISRRFRRPLKDLDYGLLKRDVNALFKLLKSRTRRRWLASYMEFRFTQDGQTQIFRTRLELLKNWGDTVSNLEEYFDDAFNSNKSGRGSFDLEDPILTAGKIIFTRAMSDTEVKQANRRRKAAKKGRRKNVAKRVTKKVKRSTIKSRKKKSKNIDNIKRSQSRALKNAVARTRKKKTANKKSVRGVRHRGK